MAASPDANLLAVVRLRSAALRLVRRFFEEREFIEVDTPTIVPSPGLDVHLSAFEVSDPSGHRSGWLATSPEYQMKRLLSAGSDRIFQVGKSYRAEESGRLHEREFTMIEWYRTHATSSDLMRDTEDLIEYVARGLPHASNTGPLVGAPGPWPTKTVAEVVHECTGRALEAFAGDDDAFFQAWVESVQPRLGLDGPLFVTDWPASMASLAKLKPNGTADRFEAFADGVELCNGFGELTDETEQRERFEQDRAERLQLGKPLYPIDERFLEALAAGMPESAGNALGFDRLLMLLVGAASIQSVMPFPEDRL